MHLPSSSRSDEFADPGAALLQFVDFKWLMAGEGHHIDVARLQADPVYARECLALARASHCATVQQVAECLSYRLARLVAGRRMDMS